MSSAFPSHIQASRSGQDGLRATRRSAAANSRSEITHGPGTDANKYYAPKYGSTVGVGDGVDGSGGGGGGGYDGDGGDEGQEDSLWHEIPAVQEFTQEEASYTQ